MIRLNVSSPIIPPYIGIRSGWGIFNPRYIRPKKYFLTGDKAVQQQNINRPYRKSAKEFFNIFFALRTGWLEQVLTVTQSQLINIAIDYFE